MMPWEALLLLHRVRLDESTWRFAPLPSPLRGYMWRRALSPSSRLDLTERSQ